jgi:hypothetical protein
MRHVFPLTLFIALLALTNSFSIAAEEPKKEIEMANKPESAPNPPPSKPEIEVINLTVYPAQIPRPVLKYRLLPTYLEMTPGNAAPLYYRCFPYISRTDGGNLDNNQELIDNWLNMPFRDLPLEKAEKVLELYPLGEINIATHRLECDWDLPLRESKEPFGISLDDMQMCRECGRIIALNARVQIARGNKEKALEYLQMGYMLAGHEATPPFMVCAMIGNAIANTMHEQLFELCQDKSAPNLYWSLTVMPHPFIDPRKAIDYESFVVPLQFKELLAAKTESHSAEQWQDLWTNFIEKHNNYVRLFEKSSGFPRIKNKFSVIDPRVMLRDKYAFVCDQLKARGWNDKAIEAKAPAQLMLLYCAEMYDEIRDESVKWTGVPCWQLPPDFMARQKEYFRQFSEKEIVPLSNYACIYYNMISSQTRLEQTTAVLRSIEALRLYASAHDGGLPANLEDIKEVPVAWDPWTNKPISYRLEGDTAVISVKSPSWQDGEFSKWATKEYRVKIAK